MVIKFCGMTNRDDVQAAADLGADFVGFVIYAKSPRYLSPTALRRLRESGPESPPAVGVFVNMSRAEVETLARDCGLAAVQIHGDEVAGTFDGMSTPVWRAVKRVGAGWQPDPEQWAADRYVVDAAVKGEYGGTGATADWVAAEALARLRPVLLAGGLQPGNVAEAIRQVRPEGVDVVSGVERTPGRKDPRLMAAFVLAVRGVDA